MVSYNVNILLLTILLFFLGVIGVIWWFQYRILFFPSQTTGREPPQPYQQIFLGIDAVPLAMPKPGATESISAWYFKFAQQKDDKTIMFCHGNNGNISWRGYIVDLCQFLGVNLLLFDYRGYGQSVGIPTPETICQDGIIVYEWLRTFCSAENVFLWGESLGGAVAVHVASRKPCARLICMSTFSSLDDIVINKSIPRWLAIPSSLVVKVLCNNLPNKSKIRTVKSPIAVMHSVDDEMIPYPCARNLYDAIGHDQKLFLEIKGAHSAPEITQEQVYELVKFCGFDFARTDTSGFLEAWLETLRSNLFSEL